MARKLPDDGWLAAPERAISLTNRRELDSGNRLKTMRIRLNGQDHDLPGPMKLSALVERLNLDRRKIAIERNLEIVPRSAYAATELAEGDRLEIVNFVGGG
jgi:thiamine biosynthesis protein ThiS